MTATESSRAASRPVPAWAPGETALAIQECQRGAAAALGAEASGPEAETA